MAGAATAVAVLAVAEMVGAAATAGGLYTLALAPTAAVETGVALFPVLALALAAAAGCGWWDIWLTSVGKLCSVCGAPHSPSGNAILVQFTYLR